VEVYSHIKGVACHGIRLPSEMRVGRRRIDERLSLMQSCLAVMTRGQRTTRWYVAKTVGFFRRAQIAIGPLSLGHCRRAKPAIDFSTDWACVLRARCMRNDNFSSTTYGDCNAEERNIPSCLAGLIGGLLGGLGVA
jgi:hypothetical protein